MTAPESMAAAARALPHAAEFAGQPERRSTVGQDIIAHRPLLSREGPHQRVGAFGHVADLDRRRVVAIQSKIVRVPGLAANAALFDDPHLRWTAQRHFVQTVASGHDGRVANVRLTGENLSNQLCLSRVRHTDELATGTRRVTERPDQVEDRSEWQLPSHGAIRTRPG